MNTPICDFVRAYVDSDPIRFHMPGHKGKAFLGTEALDITEIPGADVLYQPEGIIRESQENAAALFGSAKTCYSAEGSSLCIRAMLYLVGIYARLTGRSPHIAAGRNAHRVFLEASALLDLEPVWLGQGQDLLSCQVRPEELDALFAKESDAPAAVYLTSPDYLGNCEELGKLAEICHQHGALLLVDNAHGAYLKFLPRSRHPLDLGADLCCDSAHKTLPVLTGGAYLHFSRSCPVELPPMAERALSLFASTSPSYLILQSLDAANPVLADRFPEELLKTVRLADACKATLAMEGWKLTGSEPLKLTLCPKSRGYTGTELAAYLERKRIICEFADPDYTVFMFSPATAAADMKSLQAALCQLPSREPLNGQPPAPSLPQPVLRPRQAMLAPFERVPTASSLGRILASPSVSCPPAVPILVCGERIDRAAVEQFEYYGVEECDVVIEE